MKLIDANLDSQIEEAIQKLEAEEKKISTIRSLMVAMQSQLTRREERIRELEKALNKFNWKEE